MLTPSNELTLKEAMQAFVNSSKKLKKRLYQAKVEQYWQDTMSPAIIRYTKEIKVYRGKLYISITSAPLREELMYGKEKILALMNEHLGENYLSAVVIR
ncbi:MAG: DciA family protein [Bacteroidota bacterium]